MSSGAIFVKDEDDGFIATTKRFCALFSYGVVGKKLSVLCQEYYLFIENLVIVNAQRIHNANIKGL